MRRVLYVLTLAALATSSPVQAQNRATRTIGFEADCNNATLNTGLSGLGYKTIAPDLFAPCGLALISSAASAGGGPQIHNPPFDATFPIDGIDGELVLAGAPDSGFATGPITLTFSPAINEVSIRVLDLDVVAGLRVQVFNGSTLLNDQSPVADAQGITSFSFVTPQPSSGPIVAIERVVLTYTPGFFDTWYVDRLRYNSWSCGDGEIEAGAAEACDDTNAIQCDGCNNSCKTSTPGCLAGTVCVPNGAIPAGSFGCAVCNTSLGAPGTEKLPTSAANLTACDDGLFCTVGEQCNGAGSCLGAARDCADAAACTNDQCNEASNRCDNTLVTDGCVIGGASCVGPGAVNPSNRCQTCAPLVSTTSYSNRAQGSQCGSPSCSGGSLTPAPMCDASGSCQSQTPVSCNGSACVSPVSCTGMCTVDLECQLGFYCAPDGSCKPKAPPGGPCTGSGQCTTGFCSDGVCCNSACDGTCEACGLAGKLGICSPYAPGTDPQMECLPGQFCGGGRACVIDTKPTGQACTDNRSCQSGHCADGVCCNAACDRSCESCALKGAEGSCTPHAVGTDPELECGEARFCAEPGVCVAPELPNGEVCTSNAFCKSGYCADGVCCDGACGGACAACNLKGNIGMCTPYGAGTDPEQECSGGAVCDGVDRCVGFETRGNGLCTMVAARTDDGVGLGLLGLGVLGLLIRRRKR